MRLFVAIELSEDVRAALIDVQAGLKKWSQTVRWAEPAQLHMTLKFLGDVEEGRLPAIIGALQESAVGVPPFDLCLAAAGCFPPRGQVRIVWVGSHEETGRLLQCVEAVEANVSPLGFPREARPFAAHLTIGRVREDRSAGELRGAVEKVKVREARQRVSHVTLMQSRLSPHGASYSVVARAELAEK